MSKEEDKVQAELQASLKLLEAFRRADPNFECSINRAIAAEVSIIDDPAEGKVIKGDKTLRSPKP